MRYFHGFRAPAALDAATCGYAFSGEIANAEKVDTDEVDGAASSWSLATMPIAADGCSVRTSAGSSSSAFEAPRRGIRRSLSGCSNEESFACVGRRVRALSSCSECELLDSRSNADALNSWRTRLQHSLRSHSEAQLADAKATSTPSSPSASPCGTSPSDPAASLSGAVAAGATACAAGVGTADAAAGAAAAGCASEGAALAAWRFDLCRSLGRAVSPRPFDWVQMAACWEGPDLMDGVDWCRAVAWGVISLRAHEEVLPEDIVLLMALRTSIAQALAIQGEVVVEPWVAFATCLVASVASASRAPAADPAAPSGAEAAQAAAKVDAGDRREFAFRVDVEDPNDADIVRAALECEAASQGARHIFPFLVEVLAAGGFDAPRTLEIILDKEAPRPAQVFHAGAQADGF